MDESISDEDLVNQLQKGGNMRYFNLLTDRYYGYIRRKCKSYIKDEDLAQDLAQEVLIKLYLRLAEFKGSAKFSTWLYAIIYHTAVDHLRAQKKYDKVIAEKLATEINQITDKEEEVEPAVAMEMLPGLMQKLAPEDKMILVMKYEEKLSIQEIAATLLLSESAVKMRLLRARKRISDLVQSAS